jgi:hypothetical protein
VLPQEPGEMDIGCGSRSTGATPRASADSEARIKTLGLLGDKYVEIVSGSPDRPADPRRRPDPDRAGHLVDELMASGEDLMDNVMRSRPRCATVLERMEGGEGILGQLTTDTPRASNWSSSLVASARVAERLTATLEHRRRPAAPAAPRRRSSRSGSTTSIARLEERARQGRRGRGLLPMLLNDPASAERFAPRSPARADLGRPVGAVEARDGRRRPAAAPAARRAARRRGGGRHRAGGRPASR